MVKLITIVALISGTLFAAINAPVLAAGEVDVKQISDGIKESAGFLKEVIGAITANKADVNKIISVTRKIGASLSYIGPAFAILSVFLPDQEEERMKIIQDGFKQMNDRFDLVDRKLMDILDSVEKAAAYDDYKSMQDGLRTVWMKYEMVVKNPKNEFVRNELKDVCRSNDPDAKLDYIHHHATVNQLFPELLPSMLKDSEYNNKKLCQLSGIVISDSTIAAFLRQACLGVLAPNDTSVMQQNARTAETKITAIAKALNSLKEQLQTTFHQQRLDIDLNDKLRSMENQDHQYFANNFAAFLREKYDFVLWTVTSYDPVSGDDKHALLAKDDNDRYSYMIKETKGRNVVVAWSKEGDVDKLNTLKLEAKKRIYSNRCVNGNAKVTASNINELATSATNSLIIQQAVKFAFEAGPHTLSDMMCGFYISVSF